MLWTRIQMTVLRDESKWLKRFSVEWMEQLNNPSSINQILDDWNMVTIFVYVCVRLLRIIDAQNRSFSLKIAWNSLAQFIHLLLCWLNGFFSFEKWTIKMGSENGNERPSNSSCGDQCGQSCYKCWVQKCVVRIPFDDLTNRTDSKIRVKLLSSNLSKMVHIRVCKQKSMPFDFSLAQNWWQRIRFEMYLYQMKYNYWRNCYVAT